MNKDISLQGFISELASNSPAPGGGSAAALSGTIGTALVCMVAELTIGKEKYKEVEAEMQEALNKGKQIKDRFFTFIEEDEEAFNKVMAGYKLPKNTDEEKQIRSNAIQSALKEAVNVPLEVIKNVRAAIELALLCASKGNTNSISDAGVAGLELHASALGALYNVLINLGSIKDENFKSQVKAETEKLIKEINEFAESIEKTVLSKM
ncbi:MAG: cyclodeaminase/cyclohydrolase family protein [bacterium]|nr:cyclodeaminase/cyclohydrolase family protein [bacterium]